MNKPTGKLIENDVDDGMKFVSQEVLDWRKEVLNKNQLKELKEKE